VFYTRLKLIDRAYRAYVHVRTLHRGAIRRWGI